MDTREKEEDKEEYEDYEECNGRRRSYGRSQSRKKTGGCSETQGPRLEEEDEEDK